MSDARAELGRCIGELSARGYCRVPGVLARAEVAPVLALTQAHYERSRHHTAKKRPALVGTDPYVWNLQAKDFAFLEVLFRSTLVQDVLKHFLNDRWYSALPADAPNYILRSFLARSSADRLPMHIDSLVPYRGDEVFVMQVALCLEDQSAQHGCTRFVPGSHLSGDYVDQDAFHEAEPLVLNAGDVAIWDSRVWHGAGANETDGTRWMLVATFCRWWLKQMFDITGTLPASSYARLTDAQRAVLGFCSLPNRDETEGIDMKRGYDALPETEANRPVPR